MKPSAYLINTARGPIVDEAALLAALRDKRIAGAGLDVFWEEPLARDHPIRSLDNVVLTAVPEPSVAVLMSLGLLGIGAACRRKRA